MSSEMDLDIYFGVEIEFIAPIKADNWEGAADIIKQQLTTRRVGSRVGPHIGALPLKDRDYVLWKIVKDVSINNPRGKFGMEMSSPVFTFSDNNWKAELIEVWTALSDLEVEQGTSCSTQVHVSVARPDGQFPVEQARLIAMATVYFEKCIDALMPKYRRNSRYCQSNRDNSLLGSMSLPEIRKEIEEKEDIISLAQLVCPARHESAEHGVDSHYRVNFEGINFGTIEFRQAPGSRDAQETEDWINFVCWLVNAAISRDYFHHERWQRQPEVDDFKAFLRQDIEGDPDEFWKRIEMYKEKPDGSDPGSPAGADTGLQFEME
ncbi:putative amidoligase enzyme-domain-containing protein [Whalleya microplaca]|nr:putative amidoligase enzyme-domain-containing protein [Whalleya microplaca]